MKILVFSDLHGKIDNIKEVLNYSDFDHILFAGDIFGYFPIDLEVLDIFERNNVSYVLGNHDLYFLREFYPNIFDRKFKKMEKNMLTSEEYNSRYGVLYETIENKFTVRKEIFETADLIKKIEIEGISIIICHGSPYSPFDEYIYPESNKIDNIFNDYKFDVLILGHTHKSFIKYSKHRYIINPGSITLPRGISKPSYAIIDTKIMSVKIFEIVQKIKYKRISKNKVVIV